MLSSGKITKVYFVNFDLRGHLRSLEDNHLSTKLTRWSAHVAWLSTDQSARVSITTMASSCFILDDVYKIRLIRGQLRFNSCRYPTSVVMKTDWATKQKTKNKVARGLEQAFLYKISISPLFLKFSNSTFIIVTWIFVGKDRPAYL